MLKAAIYISILYDIHLQFQSKTSLIIKGWMDNFFKHTFPINTSIFKPQCQLFSEIYVCTQSRLKVNVELKELPQNEHMGNTITQAKKQDMTSITESPHSLFQSVYIQDIAQCCLTLNFIYLESHSRHFLNLASLTQHIMSEIYSCCM